MKRIIEEFLKIHEVSSVNSSSVNILEESFSHDGDNLCLNAENLVSLKKTKEDISNKYVAFVDGGNATIILSNNFLMQSVKLAVPIYSNNSKVKTIRKEFFLGIIMKQDELNIVTDPEQDFVDSLNIDKKTANKYLKEKDLEGFANLIRRLFELNFALELLQNNEISILVIDGSLKSKELIENKIIDKIYSQAKLTNSVVIGLSKTSSFTLKNGKQLALVAEEIAENKLIPTPWLLKLGNIESGQGLQIKTGLIKLVEKAYIPLRIDYFEKDESRLGKICELIGQSNDPIFRGYPYGLIEADKEARVTNEDIKILRDEFVLRSGNNWKKIEKSMRTKNAHELLDKMAF